MRVKGLTGSAWFLVLATPLLAMLLYRLIYNPPETAVQLLYAG